MTAVDIDAMLKHLEENPDDWDCRFVLADAYEDTGNDLIARYQRWAAKNNKRPEPTIHYYEWWWDECSSKRIAPIHARIGSHETWNEMIIYLREKHGISEYRTIPNREGSLAEVERRLALFLDHKGII